MKFLSCVYLAMAAQNGHSACVAQLLAARDNRRAPTLAPAHGLYLARVEYPESSFATTAPPPAADEDDSDDAEGPPAKRQAVT